MTSERLDVALAARGLASSRTAAQAIILAGEALVDGQVEHKASRKVTAENISDYLAEVLPRLAAFDTDELLRNRYEKFRKIGVFADMG